MDLTLMAANQVGVNIIRNITDAEIASIEAKGEIQRSKMRMAHLDEMERLKTEGERLKTEGEAIEEQKARNKVWKDNKAQYEQLKTEISDRYSKSKYRGSHIRLLTLRNNVGEKIKKTVRRMNIVVIDSAIETTTMKFNPNLNITQTLLNQKNKQIIG